MSIAPQVFSIQHYCLHDGPGVRSVVFLKGCPLRCSWCQNPESWLREPELGHKPRQCIECGTCVAVCSEGAMTAPGHWNAEACTRCFRCVERCPSGALTRFGDSRAPEALLEELRKEFPLYRRSGGGVTFSGGEPTLFPEYLLTVLAPLREAGIHTAMESCGLFRIKHGRPDDALLENDAAWAVFSAQPLWRAITALDLVLFDLKIVDRARHRRDCGADNVRIHANFLLLAGLARAGRGPALWPRMPLVPGITDDDDNIRAVARLVREAGLPAITLLPYHNLGVEKFDWLRRAVPFRDRQLADERLARARHIVEDEGLRWHESGAEDYGPARGAGAADRFAGAGSGQAAPTPADAMSAVVHNEAERMARREAVQSKVVEPARPPHKPVSQGSMAAGSVELF